MAVRHLSLGGRVLYVEQDLQCVIQFIYPLTAKGSSRKIKVEGDMRRSYSFVCSSKNG